MEQKKIGIFVGSLRQGSYSRIVAKYIAGLAPQGFVFQEIDLGGLPFYNQDFDDIGPVPAVVQEFRETVAGLSGFLFITPEYNRSFPAVLKNALDMASKPMGQNKWSNKPGAIISISPGNMGGFGANQQLRQPMGFLNIHLLKQPELYLGNIANCLDENGQIARPATQELLQKFVDSYVDWVNFINH
jgi:chromate reductase